MKVLNRIVTFTLMPLTAGIMVVLVVFGSIVDEAPGSWLWWLLVPAGFAAMLLVASLLNLSIFAPMYWLFGRRKSTNQQKQNDQT